MSKILQRVITLLTKHKHNKHIPILLCMFIHSLHQSIFIFLQTDQSRHSYDRCLGHLLLSRQSLNLLIQRTVHLFCFRPKVWIQDSKLQYSILQASDMTLGKCKSMTHSNFLSKSPALYYFQFSWPFSSLVSWSIYILGPDCENASLLTWQYIAWLDVCIDLK